MKDAPGPSRRMTTLARSVDDARSRTGFRADDAHGSLTRRRQRVVHGARQRRVRASRRAELIRAVRRARYRRVDRVAEDHRARERGRALPLSFDISTVKSHGLAAPTPDPHVFVPSVPTTLNVPSEVPGSEDEAVHLTRVNRAQPTTAKAEREGLFTSTTGALFRVRSSIPHTSKHSRVFAIRRRGSRSVVRPRRGW